MSEPETKLFCQALHAFLTTGECKFSNIPVVGPFGRLTNPQKLTVLLEVTKALITETAVPELTAVNEGAIDYVFDYLRDAFMHKDIQEAEKRWGQMILDVLGPSYVVRSSIQTFARIRELGKQMKQQERNTQYPIFCAFLLHHSSIKY